MSAAVTRSTANVPRAVLRCASCSHVIAVTPRVMRLIGVFRSSVGFRLLAEPDGLVRRRCASCGWVNLFAPQTTARTVELKSV